ncbi:hypothetical protein L9F63_011862, partial [Diploptera punctata]
TTHNNHHSAQLTMINVLVSMAEKVVNVKQIRDLKNTSLAVDSALTKQPKSTQQFFILCSKCGRFSSSSSVQRSNRAVNMDDFSQLQQFNASKTQYYCILTNYTKHALLHDFSPGYVKKLPY